MCGIIGFVGQVAEGCWGQTHSIIESLFRHAEVRGRDATGFVANAVPFDQPERSRIIWDKHPSTASEFVASSRAFRSLGHRRCTAFVGHVRAATHGTPADNRNNHPFVSDDQTLFLVHNGILSNHEEIADSLSLDRHTECDSEILLRMVETATNVAGGLQNCLRLLKGSMAIAVYDEATGSVWLAQNGGRPLWLARLRKDHRWFFASTQKILLDGIGSVVRRPIFDVFIPVPEWTPMVLTPDGRMVGVDSP